MIPYRKRKKKPLICGRFVVASKEKTAYNNKITNRVCPDVPENGVPAKGKNEYA